VISFDEMNRCLLELPSYLAEARTSVLKDDPTGDLSFRNRTGLKRNLAEWKVWRWWYQLKKAPTLRLVAQRLGLYQPTSAAAERVFSLFRHHMKANMSTASEQYLKWQAILNYNCTVDPMFGIDLDEVVT